MKMSLFDRFARGLRKAFGGREAPSAPIVQVLTTPYQAGLAVAEGWNADEQTKYYKSWAYIAIRRIAEAAAGQPLKFFQRVGEGEEPLEDAHPLWELFSRVNEIDTYRSLMESTMISLELTGNGYWHLAFSSKGALKRPREIRVLPPHRVKAKGGTLKPVDAYSIVSGGEEHDYPLDEIVHFKYGAARSMVYGRSPLQASAEAIESDEAIITAQHKAFQNGMFPGVIVSFKDRLTEDQIIPIQASLEKQYASPNKAGKVLVTHSGAETVPFTRSPREMDFLRSDMAVQRRILATFGVPEAIVGISKNVNRASAQALEYIFGRWTLWPKLQLIAQVITQNVCNWYDPEGKIFARFDSPIPIDDAAKAERLVTNVAGGVMTPNEARREMGLQPVEGGDVILVAGVPVQATPKTVEASTSFAFSKGLLYDLVDDLGVPLATDIQLAEEPATALAQAEELADSIFDREDEADRAARAFGPWVAAAIARGGRSEEAFIDKWLEGKVKKDADDDEDDILDIEKAKTKAATERFLTRHGAAAEALQERDRSYWDGVVNESTRARMVKTLATGIKKKESMTKLAGRVKKLFKQTYKNRHKVIAQTEVNSAMNAGRVVVMEARGIKHKRWVSRTDKRVRRTHKIAHHQTRTVGRKFRVGRAWLRFPGDPEADAPQESINCRCHCVSYRKGAKVPSAATIARRAARAQRAVEDPFADKIAGYMEGQMKRILKRIGAA